MMRRWVLSLASAAVLSGAAFVFADESLVATKPAPATTTAPKPAAQPADQPAPKIGKGGEVDKTFAKKHEQYVALAKKGNIDLYFSGDSITDWWARFGTKVWDKEFGGWKPGNFGIAGDRTQHVLWRLKNGELDGVKPKVFVLMIGTNNINPSYKPADIVAGNAAIIKEMQETNPQAKILLLGLFPRWADKKTKTTLSNVDQINKGLAKLDDGKNVKYMDIGKKFLAEDGTLPEDVMPDGLHPNEKGYQIWADAIKPQLKEWLGEPAEVKKAETTEKPARPALPKPQIRGGPEPFVPDAPNAR